MARKKTEEAPAGAPAWMATFSDLMNLLLCFFVLLFSMSTVDAEKFEMVIASLQSSFSILPSGGASIGDGEMVSSGVSQLQMYDIYYNQMANTQTTDDTSESSDVAEEYKEEALAESEQMAEQVQDLVAQYGIQDQVETYFHCGINCKYSDRVAETCEACDWGRTCGDSSFLYYGDGVYAEDA